jgi:hypothetical protein
MGPLQSSLSRPFLPDTVFSPAHKLLRPPSPCQCIKEVGLLIKDKILVGHAVHNDLKVRPMTCVGVVESVRRS